MFHALAVDAVHDLVQTLVDVFGRPTEVHGVLAHFETGSGDTAGVHGLARCVKHLVSDEFVDGFGRTSHVRDFAYAEHAVINEVLRVVAVEFVLRSAGKGNIDLDFPRTLAFNKLRTGEFFGIGGDNVVAGGAQFEHIVDFLATDAVGIINVAVGAADGDNFCAELRGFGGSSPCYIAETGDRHGLSLDVVTGTFEHFTHKVETAEAGGLGTHQTAAEFEILAGEYAGEITRETLVLSEEVADFACTNTDIACGNVDFGADVAIKLGHKRLTEAHNLGIALAARREVGTAFAAAHGKGGKCVLKCLFEAEKFQNAQVHRSMEAKSSFIGADGGVELHAIADVHLHFAFIIDPRHTESDDALGFYQAFEQRSALPLRMLVVDVGNAEEHFVNGLEILFLTGVASFELLHEKFDVHGGCSFWRGVCVASCGLWKETGVRSDANGRLDYLIISQPM